LTTEQKLITNCQNGDKRSQYLLVEKYSGMLLTICRRYARDEAMAYDLVQETLILIFKNIKSYQHTGSFEGWMRRIAINASLQWIGKSYFKNESSTIDFVETEFQDPAIFSQLGEEEIIKHIQTLPDGYRTVLNLYIIEGMSHKEIAEILNISINTSRSQLMRGRKSLIEKLTDFPKKASA